MVGLQISGDIGLLCTYSLQLLTKYHLTFAWQQLIGTVIKVNQFYDNHARNVGKPLIATRCKFSPNRWISRSKGVTSIADVTVCEVEFDCSVCTGACRRHKFFGCVGPEQTLQACGSQPNIKQVLARCVWKTEREPKLTPPLFTASICRSFLFCASVKSCLCVCMHVCASLHVHMSRLFVTFLKS